jgi:Flp pilus assembly protein TadG
MLNTNRTGSRRGAVAVLVALSLTFVIGAVAIVADGGLLLSDRRRVQGAADNAALAAAVDLFTNWNTNAGADPSGTAAKSAQTTAIAHGFTNDGVTSTVTVNIPPKSGTFVNKTGYAEVIITNHQPRFFSQIWGQGAIVVNARAVARGTYTPGSAGIIILDPSSKDTLSVTGNGSVTVTGGGGIDVDSNSANGAAGCTGNGNIVATTINLCDNTYKHSGNGTITGTINYNQGPTPDPLATLPEPAQPGLPIYPPAQSGLNYDTTNGVNYSGSTTLDLYPGYYGGINVTGNGSVVLHDNNGSPGIYYIGSQGFSVTGGGGLSGSNVMIYSNGTGNISATGSGSVTLSSPTSGTYQGISLFQERSSNKQVSITGQGNMNLTGTFYAAGAKVSITGQGNYSASQFFSWQLDVTGSGGFTATSSSGSGTPMRLIQLVE